MAVELYGKMDEIMEEKAISAHLTFVKSKAFDQNLSTQRGSQPMLKHKEGYDVTLTPPVKEPQQEIKKEEPKQEEIKKEEAPAQKEPEPVAKLDEEAKLEKPEL